MSAAQLALDALKLLDPNLKFEDWENGQGEEIGVQLRKAAASLKAELAQPVGPVAWSVTVGQEYKNCIEITHCKEDAVARYEVSTEGGFESIYTLHELYAAPQEPAAPGLLDALRLAVELTECGVIMTNDSGRQRLIDALTQWNKAIAKATGVAP